MSFMKTRRILLLFFVVSFSFISCTTYIIPPDSIPESPIELKALRASSFPFISGDTYRAFCDFVIDSTRIPFDPKKVKDGDAIFLSAWALDFFFSVIHPHIKNHYILITHHSDATAPGKFERYLDDEKLVAWFGQNSDIVYHKKFFPIPIGLANLYYPHGDISIVKQEREQGLSGNRDIILYMNFTTGTNKAEREPVWQLFKDKFFCYNFGPKPFRSYLKDLKRAQFILSPPGSGPDCHRHWEALLMGAIPIIKHSPLDPLFEGLPVLLVNDWDEVTLDFLHAAYIRIHAQKFEYEKLFAPYWLNKIEQVKTLTRQKYSL